MNSESESELVYLTNVQIHLCQHHNYIYKDNSHSGSLVIYIRFFFMVIYIIFLTKLQIREFALSFSEVWHVGMTFKISRVF